ncbi:TIGR04066 family peptide maturation system protein [Ruminiclostridium josui]|uniref:TIGR04066 family peptide maturation system protein n=1 Tax=Ruminiclostridium josui TaxID=1499 RepID=UPI000551532E|nr:TIGR04066 family peptide maturation system protein [Ruminiclostridium josui]
MKSKYNTMIYPFDIDSVSLIRHNDIVEDYTFVHAVSPNGWGLTGKDAGCADDGEPTGLIVESDFNKALEDCDTVIFVTSSIELDFINNVYPKIIKAAESSKNIVCAIKLEEETLLKVSEICSKNDKFFKYLIDDHKASKNLLLEKIFKVDVPIIFVAGLCEQTNKFEVQLNIRKNLMKMGYKVSQIGTRNYCDLMGFHSFPQFMFEKDFYEWEKVTLFNYYVRKIEIEEEPDVIVIGIPGTTIPFNETFPSKFGILAYMVSQAVTPDVTVLTTLYQKGFSKEYFDLMSKVHENKFGYSIDCYNIANSIFNSEYSRLVEKMQFVTLDYKFISEKIKSYSNLQTPVFNILDKNDGKRMTEFLVNKLSEYAV